MTVFTRPRGLLSEEILITPLPSKFDFDSRRFTKPIVTHEEKIQLQEARRMRAFDRGGAICAFFTMMMLILLVLVGATMVYQHALHVDVARTFRGHCSVPILNDFEEVQNSRLPLQWSMDPQAPVVRSATVGDLMNALHEQLDLGITVEKISVVHNGRRVNFIHDFSDNTTGIADDDRCFLMGLNPEVVLNPEVFISGLKLGRDFDVSRVRSHMKATLPSMGDMSRIAFSLITQCSGKPIYYLQQNEGTVIRKRSAQDPQSDYMHFSGKHVLELKIENLPELLAYEEKIKNK